MHCPHTHWIKTHCFLYHKLLADALTRRVRRRPVPKALFTGGQSSYESFQMPVYGASGRSSQLCPSKATRSTEFRSTPSRQRALTM